jgi:hypothetical protein
MENKRRLPIDMGDLVQALEGFGDASYTTTWYLDLETGDIFFLSDFDIIEEMEEMAEMVDAQPDRFEAIDEIDTQEAYSDMAAFVETVSDRRTAARLADAIEGRGAFSRFRDTLARYPAEQERWWEFKDQRMRERALEWLEDIGVEPLPRAPRT